jgi:CubicO group peptidase (beta-lactamase class C family)
LIRFLLVSFALLPTLAGQTAADLNAFLDGAVPKQLSREKIAGAVVAVVKDGDVLASRGYGFADIEKKIPMTGEVLVRPASISKLFTAIAALQLVRQGKLDLDRDVNDYLDFHIPVSADAVPITLRLLLTHRAGFEDHLKDFIKAGGTPEPLDAWLRENLPRRLYPHGDVPAYSNYGYALAGYLVQRASGERFEDYAAAQILKPLGMERSTFEQPPPLLPFVALGYPVAAAPPIPFFEMLPAPAGGMSTTADDQSRFLRALLSRDTRLEPELMSKLAFEEDYAAGNRFIGKHGLTTAVVSELALLPEDHFGLFVSYNSGSAGNAPTELLGQLAERYFKKPAKPLGPMASAVADARLVAGTYQRSQRSDSSFLRLNALNSELTVEALPDGRIRFAGRSRTMVETAPMVFEAAGDLRVVFRKTRDGGMAMSYNAMPLAMEWERVPLYLDKRWVMPVVEGSMAVMILTLVAWPILTGRLLMRVALVLQLAAIAGSAVFTSLNLTRWNASLDPLLIFIYACAWLGVLGALMAAWMAWRCWRSRSTSPWLRIHQTALAAAMLIFAWFCVVWRIAGTSLSY